MPISTCMMCGAFITIKWFMQFLVKLFNFDVYFEMLNIFVSKNDAVPCMKSPSQQMTSQSFLARYLISF